MKKLFLIFIATAISLTGCQKLEDAIEALDNRVTELENTTIPTINEQIQRVNQSITDLEATDAELKSYISTLQNTATELQKSINTTNACIDGVKIALQTEISIAKSDVLAQLEALKAETNNELAQISTTIDSLKAKDAALEGKITALKAYVDTELGNTKDWASATFSTLEQYDSLCIEIASIKTQIESLNTSIEELEARLNDKIAADISAAVEGLREELAATVMEITASYVSAIGTAKIEITEAYTDAIKNAISALETSMKQWVNEKLAGYYTIAEVEAMLDALAYEGIEADNEIKEDIETLQEELVVAKKELTEGYKNAIAEAIISNNGVINEKIAKEIDAVNGKILKIEERLETIESRLSAVEDAIEQMKALDITFDEIGDKACLAGASVYVEYTISGGDAETTIEAWGDGGWSAMVMNEDATRGKIIVTAPNDATNGKVVVLATSGAGGVKMKTLYFAEGILTNINDTYEVDWEVCTLEVVLQTNLSYSINVPESALDWITLAKTRAAVRTESIVFHITENPEEQLRSTTIELVGECGDVLQTFDIVQKPQPSDGYIEFADKYAKVVCVENFDINKDGEISFKEASKVTSIGEYFFGDYANAITSFDELQYFANVEEIKKNAFRACANLKNMTLPNSISKIEDYTFYYCSNLEEIIIPNDASSIGVSAFAYCKKIESIILPNGVTVIKDNAFAHCEGLRSAYIPNNITIIESEAFRYCNSLESITIPSGKIDMLAFAQCDNLKKAAFGDAVTSIGNSAFGSCPNLITVTIGTGIETIDKEAFKYCQNLEGVYCEAINPPTLGDCAFHYDSYTPSAKCSFYVPAESVWLYKTTKWKVYADYIIGYDFE